MSVIDGRTWLEIIQPSTCWALLAEAQVGRIGVLVDGAPEIYPVNHVVDGTSIVFRTDRGSKLLGLDRSPFVCFQIDCFDALTCTGWSVLVKGRATTLVTSADIRRAESLPLWFWPRGPKSHWVSIRADEVTGRRIQQNGRSA